MKISFRKWLKLKEMVGTSAIVGGWFTTADYQVWGACSDLKKKQKPKK